MDSPSEQKTGGLFLKAIGEYSLLFSIMRSKSPSSYIEFSPLFNASKIRNSICAGKSDDALSPSVTQTLLLLRLLSGDRHCSSSVGHLLNEESCAPPMEKAYVNYKVKGDYPFKYWIDAIDRYLRFISDRGVSRAMCYQLTHLVFFSTDFGSLQFPASNEKAAALRDVILELYLLTAASQDYDLLVEIGTCLALLPECGISRNAVQDIASTISAQQSESGWVLSDATTSYTRESNISYASGYIAYSVYHTTCVSIIFTIVLASYASADAIEQRPNNSCMDSPCK